MNRRATPTHIVVACVGLLAFAGASGAAAQLPADASWRTIQSTHFRVTYEADLEALARHAAASAERAYATLSVLVAQPPRGMIDLVLADNVDVSNGFASPFPGNRIVIYARPPFDVIELQHSRDWIELVVTHELAHTFHLDVTSEFGRALRALFGRMPAPWPVFPALGAPAWNVEGLATTIESEVTGFGRVNGSYHEMVVRTAALAGTLDEYDRLATTSTRWPGPARAYIHGSLFMDYLARRFGPDANERIVHSTANALVPPALWFGRVGSSALGITFRDAYRDWRREVDARSDSLASVLSAEGLTTGTRLTDHRAIAMYPRFSRDGSRIVYAAWDWRSPPQLRVIGAQDGTAIREHRVNQPTRAAWLDNARIVVAEIDFVDQFRMFSDLRVHGDNDRRITRRARLQDPDVTRDGRIVAIQNEGGTNRVVLVDAATGTVTPLTQYDAGTFLSLPRFSPDGQFVAAARWQVGGAHDIVVIDALGTTRSLTDGFGSNSEPAWSPDGRWILFSSDRSGVPNIYAVDVAAAGTLRQVTNVLTGVFQPDVSPDGRWIAYAAAYEDGFRIERIAFDTASWRVPAPAGFARRIAPRPVYQTVDENEARAFIDSATVAFATADTIAGAPRRYNPLHSLRPYYWAPTLDVSQDHLYGGIMTSGRDLVGRHDWFLHASLDPGPRRTQGRASYTYSGLPTIPGIGLHPSLGAVIERDWDRLFNSPDPANPYYVDEREDAAAFTIGFTRARWRTNAGLALSGEAVRRARYLYDAPVGSSLIDTKDDLLGVRANAFLAHYVMPPLAISREDGVTLQVAGRHRWDRDVRTVTIDSADVLLDGGYSEVTTWNTAYIALPLPGFARHVLALRFSGLLRDGNGASHTSIGGAGGSGFRVPGIAYTLGSTSLLLPVRGFPRGVRTGTDAWTASLEYRFPIALVDAVWRAAFLDRVSGTIFTDAGHAWCGDDIAFLSACTSTSPSDAPLVSAGIEIVALGSLWGVSTPLRFGAAMPLRGSSNRNARVYVLTGHAF